MRIYKQIWKLRLKLHLKKFTFVMYVKNWNSNWKFLGIKFINTSFWVNIREEKEGLILYLSFLYYVNNSRILNILKLCKEWRNYISRSKPSFSYLTLAFYVIFLSFRVLDQFHFHLKWYQSKWTRVTQPLICPTLLYLKLGREELHRTWNQAGERGIVFI